MADNKVEIEDGMGDRWTFFLDEVGGKNAGRVTLVEANRIAYIEAWYGTKEYISRRLQRDDLPGLAEYLLRSERLKLIGYIAGMRVEPSARGRGLGGALVRHVLDGLKRIGIKKVYLHRNAERSKDVHLKSFYEQYGFKDFRVVDTDTTPVMVMVAQKRY